MKTVILIVLLPALIVSSAFGAVRRHDSAPFFSIKDNAGNDFILSEYAGPNRTRSGHGLLLSFFASWCAPCRAELPLINSLVDDLQKKGITVVIIGVKENFGQISELLRELRVDKPLVLSDGKGKVSELYGVRFLPMTFLIGEDGTVKDVFYGEISNEQELTRSIKTWLPQ